MKLIILKSITAVLSAWLFFYGGVMLMSQVSVFGGKTTLIEFLPILAVSTGGCFLIGWVNCRSVKRAVGGALAAMFIGIPVAYLFLSEAAETIMDMIVPYTFSASGSFSSIWFLLSPIVMIEVMTDNALRRDRRLGLLIGVATAAVISVGIETYMMRFGRTFESVMLTEALYAPLVWGIVVTAVNVYTRQSSGTV